MTLYGVPRLLVPPPTWRRFNVTQGFIDPLGALAPRCSPDRVSKGRLLQRGRTPRRGERVIPIAVAARPAEYPERSSLTERGERRGVLGFPYWERMSDVPWARRIAGGS